MRPAYCIRHTHSLHVIVIPSLALMPADLKSFSHMKSQTQIVRDNCRFSEKIGSDSLKSHSTMNVKMSNIAQPLASSKSISFLLSHTSTFSVMLIIIQVHVHAFQHLGMITFNSSSVADIRLFIQFLCCCKTI